MCLAVGATSPKYSNKWIWDTWTGPDGFSEQDNEPSNIKWLGSNCFRRVSLSSNVWYLKKKKIKFVKIDIINYFQISRNIYVLIETSAISGE